MNAYDVGDVIRSQATFTNSAGTAVDPSTITFQHRLAASDPSSYTTLIFGVNSITRAGAGVYYTDLTLDQRGEWLVRWNGLGANAGAAEGAFQARERRVG